MTRPPPRWRRLAANLAVLGASALVALGIAEAALRLFPRLLPEEAELRLHWRELGERRPSSVAHPYVGFLYPPHHREERRRGDLQFSFLTDERGFRNPSPWPPAAEIVVVGDSEAFGYGADDDEAWSRLVSDGLPRSRLVNLAMIGAAPQQYVRVFETFGTALRPRLLVFGLFPGNDIRDAALFEQWLEAGSPGNYDVWRFFRGDVPGSTRPRDLLRRSYLVVALNEARRNLGHPFSGRTLTLSDGRRLRLAPGMVADDASRARPDHPDFRRVLEAIERGRETAAGAGAAFLVVLFPTKEEVYLPILDARTPELTAPFAAAMEERGIPVLDLTPPFREEARRGAGLFFEVDGHPNPEGNALIARLVLEHLREHGAAYGLEDWEEPAPSPGGS